MMLSKGLNVVLGGFLAAALAAPGVAAAQLDEGPKVDQSKDYYAVLQTSMGDIALELYEEKAPVTVQNFVNLAEGTREYRDKETGQKNKEPFYDNTTFHRVMPNFMIQGGDPSGTGRGGPGYQFEDEFHPDLTFSKPGLLAMANSGPNTNGSQFFITEVPTPHLNRRHTIFGEILEGTDGLKVVKEIARVPTGEADKPEEPVVIEGVEVHRFDEGTDKETVRQEILGGGDDTSSEKDSSEEKPEAAREEEPATQPADSNE